jgi:hypothetical protein
VTGSAHEDDLLDADAAAEVLQVAGDRIEVMVEEGLLTPEDDGRFRRAEVEALRHQGG